MTGIELRDIFNDVTYKPGWILYAESLGDGFYVQWRFDGTHERQHGRKWYISRHCTRSEVVQTLLKAAITAEEHETREQFLYKGVAIFGPHQDVDGIVAFLRELGSLQAESRRRPLASE